MLKINILWLSTCFAIIAKLFSGCSAASAVPYLGSAVSPGPVRERAHSPVTSLCDYRYGPYQRWIPPEAPSQVQHSIAGGAAPASAAVPEPVPEETQGFRRYKTRMGPRAPSPVPQR